MMKAVQKLFERFDLNRVKNSAFFFDFSQLVIIFTDKNRPKIE